MAKNMTNAMYDGGLTKMNTCTRVTVLSGEPTTMADITTNMKLATVAMTSGTDYTLAAGDVSGRKSTTAAKSSVSITASGTATHVAIDDGTDWIVTTCTSQALTSGGTVTIPAWKREINAAT